MSGQHYYRRRRQLMFSDQENQARIIKPSSPAKALMREIFLRQRRKFLRFLAQVIADEIENPRNKE